MNIGKPFCEVDMCMRNAENGYDFCLEHNPKYIEGKNDFKNDLLIDLRNEGVESISIKRLEEIIEELSPIK